LVVNPHKWLFTPSTAVCFIRAVRMCCAAH
jgi:hypothetical protein